MKKKYYQHIDFRELLNELNFGQHQTRRAACNKLGYNYGSVSNALIINEMKLDKRIDSKTGKIIWKYASKKESVNG